MILVPPYQFKLSLPEEILKAGHSYHVELLNLKPEHLPNNKLTEDTYKLYQCHGLPIETTFHAGNILFEHLPSLLSRNIMSITYCTLPRADSWYRKPFTGVHLLSAAESKLTD